MRNCPTVVPKSSGSWFLLPFSTLFGHILKINHPLQDLSRPRPIWSCWRNRKCFWVSAPNAQLHWQRQEQGPDRSGRIKRLVVSWSSPFELLAETQRNHQKHSETCLLLRPSNAYWLRDLNSDDAPFAPGKLGFVDVYPPVHMWNIAGVDMFCLIFGLFSPCYWLVLQPSSTHISTYEGGLPKNKAPPTISYHCIPDDYHILSLLTGGKFLFGTTPNYHNLLLGCNPKLSHCNFTRWFILSRSNVKCGNRSLDLSHLRDPYWSIHS